MRRHSFIIRAAAVACPLVLAVAIVPAVGAKPRHKPKGPSVNCKSVITTEVPAGQTVVLPASPTGEQFGTISCGKPGHGLERTSFTIPASGNIQGSFWAYFGTGSVKGKFNIAAQEGELSPTSFSSGVYTGTVKVTGGTGTDAHSKGSGAETCKTVNGLTFDCSIKLNLAS